MLVQYAGTVRWYSTLVQYAGTVRWYSMLGINTDCYLPVPSRIISS